MLEATEKATLIEAANAIKSGMFVHIHGYINQYGEKANITVHADASYESVHQRSLTILNQLVDNPNLQLKISRNYWRDSQGNKFTRKAKDRVLITGVNETVLVTDPDFQAAVEKLRQSITNPKKVETGYEKIAASTYDNSNTGKTYFTNVLIHAKEVVTPGEYPTTCSERVNVIKDALLCQLPLGQYRTYMLEEGKFEYLSIMHHSVSSSSSSEE